MIKKGVAIADSGALISLACVNKLNLLDDIFAKIFIPQAVWNEITSDSSKKDYKILYDFFKNRIKKIQNFNNLTFIMDYGEAEAVILYQEIDADFLLIDDKKARTIAESLNIKCIGTLGLLASAKKNGQIENLKNTFSKLIENKRFYSISVLNKILQKFNERKFNNFKEKK